MRKPGFTEITQSGVYLVLMNPSVSYQASVLDSANGILSSNHSLEKAELLTVAFPPLELTKLK